MLDNLGIQISALTTVAVCIFAVLFGGGREKAAGGIGLAGVAIQTGASLLWPDAVMARYMVADAVVLGVLVSLCWKAPRPWPLWASGLQLLSLMAATVTLRNPELTLDSFLTLRWMSGLGVMVVIAIATIQAMAHRRRIPAGQTSEL